VTLDGVDFDHEPVGAVTFDLDETLVFYRRTPGEVLADAFEAVGVEPLFPVEAYYDRFEEFAGRTDTIGELRRECFAALADEQGYDPETGAAVAAAYADARDHGNVRWRAGAERLVDALDDCGVPYAVVTNGPPDAQRQKLDAVGLTDRIVTAVFAGYDCPAKPDPEPFDRALSALDADPAETVHVGDGESDVRGARAAGLHPVHVEGLRENAASDAGGDGPVTRRGSLTTLLDGE
jgi:HAD superfamily hydrolase (TIGR01509 family)